MKKVNKFLSALLLSTGTLISLASCGMAINEPGSSSSDPEIQAIYQTYRDNGGTLSYEEWLASIKGEPGKDGVTPTIGENGNWWIGESDTGVKAEGTTPTVTINDDGYWVINGTVTTIKATGDKGKDGTSILTGKGAPEGTIGKDGDSYIDTDTFDYYVKADGVWGKSGNIKGNKGSKGEEGDRGLTGDTGRAGFIVKDADELAAAVGADNSYIILSKDISITEPLNVKYSVVIDLNGKTLTSTLTHEDDTDAEKYGYAFEISGKDANVSVKNGIIKSANDGAFSVKDGAMLTLANITVEAEYECAFCAKGATLSTESGKYTSRKGYVIGTSKENGYGDNAILIGGGEFNSQRVEGYSLGCGIYLANNDSLGITNGTFNITDGVGILARSGTTYVADEVVFNSTQSSGVPIFGTIGDCNALLYTGKDVVIHKGLGYPGGEPEVSAKDEWKFYVASVLSADALKAAIEDARYQIINLASDIDISERLDITRSVRIDLCGYTITMKDYTNESAVGVFNAGVDGTVHKIEVHIQNGKIDGTACTQEVDDGNNKECNPIIARNGAKIFLDNMTIEIDSITGACAFAFAKSDATDDTEREEDGKIDVNSGIYINNATEDYPYASGWKALTLNQSNVSSKLITVYSGTFTGMDPAKGDDSGLCTTFLPSTLSHTSTLVAGTTNTYVVKSIFAR